MKYLKTFENYKINESFDSDDDKYREVYAAIEMAMRPDQDSLSYGELEDICINTLMEDPDEDSMAYVSNVMVDYLKKRDSESESELKYEVEDCIKYLKDEEGKEDLPFGEFYDWFEKGGWQENMLKTYTKDQVKVEFDNLTKDPNQLELPLHESLDNLNERCHSCETMTINGIKTHEQGCPEAWKDEKRECKWCGTKFKPESFDQKFCDDSCTEDYNS
jgi:hypothetical protein